MGQSLMGAEPEDSRPDEDQDFETVVNGNRATGSTAQPTEFAQDYLSRYAGSSPRSRGSQSRTARSQILEERTKAAMAAGCCHLPIVGISDLTDRSITSATSGKSIGTDVFSLLDVNDDGRIDCGEVWRAICMVDPETSVNGEVSTKEGAGYFNVNHSRDDAEVETRKVATQLEVPAEFESISFDWTMPSANQLLPSASQQEILQSCMKPFIQTMLTGVLLRLRLEPGETPDGDPGGQSIDATITLSEDFSLLSIAAGGAQRSIPIKDIRVVRPSDGRVERCADLLLTGDRFVRFNFDTQAQTKYFGTCMRLLVKASRSTLSNPSGRPPQAA